MGNLYLSERRLNCYRFLDLGGFNFFLSHLFYGLFYWGIACTICFIIIIIIMMLLLLTSRVSERF